MNSIIITIISIYAVLTLYFFFRFYTSGFSLSDTMSIVKKDFKKIFKCCINKKNIEEKFSKDKADELEGEMNKLTAEDEDCKEPFGVPLDICLNGELAKEEIEIREKVLKTLNKKDMKVFDGGKEKLIVPMEAILFLTKSLNPLVSEQGDITIKVKREHSPRLDTEEGIPSEELEKLVIQLKDKDSVLYKDDDELVKTINSLIQHKALPSDINVPIVDIKPQEIEVEPVTVKEEVIKPEQPEIEQLNGPDEDLYPNPEKKVMLHTPTNSSSPYDDEDEISDFSDQNDMFDTGDDLNDLLMQELENIEIDDEDDVNEKKSFYTKLEYKTVKNMSIDFEYIEDSFTSLFSKDETFYALFKNIAKLNPLVYNGNKTVMVVDQNIILFAIAKMFGMDSKVYIDKFKKLNKEKLKEINKILVNSLDIYLSDLLSGNKNPNFYLMKDKSGEHFFSFAFVFQTNAFKTSFTSEEFDYFRSFPYNVEYEFIKKASKEESTNASQLILDIKDVENK